MKNVYKILGAAGLISLLLFASIVVAAPAQQQPVGEQSLELEQALKLESEPVDPEQPLGIFPSDIILIDVQKTALDQIEVTVKNNGPGFAWAAYTVHVHINGIANGDDDIENIRTISPGSTATKRTRPFVGGIVGRGYVIKVDYTNKVWEGFFGELNNRYTGIV